MAFMIVASVFDAYTTHIGIRAGGRDDPWTLMNPAVEIFGFAGIYYVKAGACLLLGAYSITKKVIWPMVFMGSVSLLGAATWFM